MTKNEEKLMSWTNAGIAMIPVVGGAINSLISDKLQAETTRKINYALDHLKTRVTELEDRIEADNINEDQFFELFKSCYLIIVRTHHEARLKVVSNLLANLFLKNNDPEKFTYNELDHFVRALDQLSLGALEVLPYIVKAAYRAKRHQFKRADIKVRFKEIIIMSNGEISPDLLMGLLGELNSFHITHKLSAGSMVHSDDYEHYEFEFTRLGTKFALYLMQVNPEEKQTNT